jgi:hypothetical protein
LPFLKQFEDAIKATKEGKACNYNELPVPPGFARIPLKPDGRPILGPDSGTSSDRSSLQPSTLSSNRASQQQQANNKSPSQATRTSHVPSMATTNKTEAYDNDELGDDLLAQLENEIDDNDLDDDPNDHDPELANFNKKLKNLMPNIKNLGVPMDYEGLDNDMDIEKLMIGMDDDDDDVVDRPTGNKAQSKAKLPPQPVRNAQSVAPPPPQIKVHQAAKPAVANKKPASKELSILVERQRLFKEAAVQAKKDGNTNVALVYLRHSKGFDQMILAAENGLPLDMNNVIASSCGEFSLHLTKSV